jgi:O-antigen ligase
MTVLRPARLAEAARDLPLLVVLAAVALSLIRSVDQPGFDVAIPGTEASIVAADAALAVLAALVLLQLAGRGSLPRPARSLTFAAAAFFAWLLLSSATNGSAAIVAAAKLLEFGVIALGLVVFVRRRLQLWLLVTLLVLFATAAVGYAILGFFGVPFVDSPTPGGRQDSFIGQHELAALSTMVLSFGVATFYVPQHRLGRLPLLAVVVGVIGVVLGAALASLLALYLACGAIVAIALARRTAGRRALAVTAVVLLVATAGTVGLRGGDITAFLRYLGIAERSAVEDENAASWSQRLIYVYVGGRIFLANPVIGTGWHGSLPPGEYARFLPDARARFPDQPTRYFPPARGTYIPQQTYDQVLYQLGIVGALLFLGLAGVAVRTALRVERSWPRGDPDEAAAYLPAAWLAALSGALVGAALFGGTPIAAMFWLTLGVTALAPSLVPPPRPPDRPRQVESVQTVPVAP